MTRQLTSSEKSIEFDLNSRKLTGKILENAYQRHFEDGSNDEFGETILKDTGTLIRLPSLQRIVWEAPLEWLTPNPHQPRSYFDPKKMRELKSTISSVGQKEPIKTVPYIDDNQTIRLFIVDGERRYRTLCDLGRDTGFISIGGEVTEEEIFDTSVILNLSRAQHNPIEIALAFQRRMESFEKDPQRDFKKRVTELVADKYGFSEASVYSHLRLLSLPEEIREMIAQGNLPMQNALALLKRKHAHNSSPEAEKYRLQLLARNLLEQIRDERFQEDSDGKIKSGGNGKITREALQRANYQALIDQGRSVDAIQLRVAENVHALVSSLSGLKNKTNQVLDPKHRQLVVAGLRSLGHNHPPEVIRDKIHDLLDSLFILGEMAEEATLPPKLVVPAGKPKFSTHIEKRIKNFGSKLRQKLAKALAYSSDKAGQVLSWSELSQVVGLPEYEISGNINLLREEFSRLGLDLQSFQIRRKDINNKYNIYPAYRLSWKDARNLNPLQAETLNFRKIKTDKIDNFSLSKIVIESQSPYDQAGNLELAEMLVESVQGLGGAVEINPVRGTMVCLLISAHKGKSELAEVKSNIRNFSLNFSHLERKLLALLKTANPSLKGILLSDIYTKEEASFKACKNGSVKRK